MGYFRKHFFSLAFIVLASFLAVMTAQSYHHHEGTGTQERDCSLCSWQLTSSHATTSPVVPMLFSALSFVFSFSFKPSYFSLFSFPSPGRSPPQNLL